MMNEYDFSNARKNPYVKRLKKQITINLDNETIEYFKQLSESTGIPYQTLINMFLADCAKNKRQPNIVWN
ncbi:MAG: BrnA antitoxin family protein [Clostridia bacterium]|nr:BrnA antitoxin family protein [Clostridia bacterium]